jgi:ribonuclease Z
MRAVLFLLLAPAALPAQELKVTLLGTGGPEPAVECFGPGTLVEAGAEKLVFDAGRGTSQRLWQRSIKLGDVTAVLLTHLHSDHVVGLPDLWLTGLQSTAFGGRQASLQVWGPRGTEDLVANMRRAFEADIQQRRQGARLSDSAIAASGHDIVQGVVFERGGVKVTAFTVDHGVPVLPAFGYRVDYAGRSAVISGDTRPSENIVRFAQGADVLIHEVMAARPAALQQSESARRVMSSHTSPEDAGRIFARVKPKLAVYTHVSVVAGPRARDAVLSAIRPRTSSTYGGAVEVGEDLMTISIGERVVVERVSGPVR